MKQNIEAPKAIRRVIQAIRSWRALVALAILTLALASAGISVTHVSAANDGATTWPAYYEDEVYSILMGPGDNSASQQQIRNWCWGLGPDIAKAAKPKGLPAFYAIFYPDANQMGCPGPEYSFLSHDMILSTVPGEPGYSPHVQVSMCNPVEGFEIEAPYTNAGDVEVAIGLEQLECSSWPGALFAPVVGGPGAP